MSIRTKPTRAQIDDWLAEAARLYPAARVSQLVHHVACKAYAAAVENVWYALEPLSHEREEP